MSTYSTVAMSICFHLMANIWEKVISILVGNLNLGLSYLITTVWTKLTWNFLLVLISILCGCPVLNLFMWQFQKNVLRLNYKNTYVADIYWRNRFHNLVSINQRITIVPKIIQKLLNEFGLFCCLFTLYTKILIGSPQ